MIKTDLTYDRVKQALLLKGYTFFTGNLNLNMVGIRTKNRKVDNWDDFFCLLWEENGQKHIWVNEEFTTDPGIYYLQTKLLNEKGCAFVKPGQYRSLWEIGQHNGKYKAFVQTGRIDVYRDRDKNNYLNPETSTLDSGFFGINQHHGYGAQVVGPNSAGCQVHRRPEELQYVLQMAERSIPLYGKKFTYTLLEETDFH
jgi:hypothetical protein